MKRWMICVGYTLCMFAVSNIFVFAGEADGPKGLERQTNKVESVQEKAQEDCASISMDELIERLKGTNAIGFFTKLAIRSDVVGFQNKVKAMRKNNQLKDKVETIKASFNGLLLKIMTLLEKDPNLSKDIYLARDSILKSLLEVQG